MRARCVICGEMWNVSIYQSIPKTGYICPACTKKMCCSVAKQKQHKQNKTGLNFNILAKEIQEWTNFGFDNSQIMFLVHRVIGGNSNGL